MDNKKIIYTVLAVIFHLYIPHLIGGIFENLFAESYAYWIVFILLILGNAVLAFNSLHETKKDINALGFVFGDYIGRLKSGTTFVPFGFWKGSVQEYTKADFPIEEIINVVKLKDVPTGEESEYYYHLDGKKNKETDEKITKKALAYKMHIKLQGPYSIKDPYQFFIKTGIKKFLPETIEKNTFPAYKIIMSDLASDMDTIAADYGYAQFKDKTDWTLKEISKECREITGKSSDFKKTIKKYGITIGKIATYTKLDETTEKILTDILNAEAEQGPALKRANTQAQAEAIKVKKAAEAEAEAIKVKGKADANVKAYEVETVGDKTRKVFTQNVEEFTKLLPDLGSSGVAQNARLATPGMVDKEFEFIGGTTEGKSPHAMFADFNISGKNADLSNDLIGLFGIFENLSPKTQETLKRFFKDISGLDSKMQERKIITAIKKVKGD